MFHFSIKTFKQTAIMHNVDVRGTDKHETMVDEQNLIARPRHSFCDKAKPNPRRQSDKEVVTARSSVTCKSVVQSFWASCSAVAAGLDITNSVSDFFWDYETSEEEKILTNKCSSETEKLVRTDKNYRQVFMQDVAVARRSFHESLEDMESDEWRKIQKKIREQKIWTNEGAAMAIQRHLVDCSKIKQSTKGKLHKEEHALRTLIGQDSLRHIVQESSHRIRENKPCLVEKRSMPRSSAFSSTMQSLAHGLAKKNFVASCSRTPELAPKGSAIRRGSDVSLDAEEVLNDCEHNKPNLTVLEGPGRRIRWSLACPSTKSGLASNVHVVSKMANSCGQIECPLTGGRSRRRNSIESAFSEQASFNIVENYCDAITDERSYSDGMPFIAVSRRRGALTCAPECEVQKEISTALYKPNRSFSSVQTLQEASLLSISSSDPARSSTYCAKQA